MFEGFAVRDIDSAGARIHGRVGGSGIALENPPTVRIRDADPVVLDANSDLRLL